MICEWQTFLWWWWWWWLGLLWKIEAHPSFPQFIQPRLALCLIRLGRSEENMTIDHFATWPNAAGYFASHKNNSEKGVSAATWLQVPTPQWHRQGSARWGCWAQTSTQLLCGSGDKLGTSVQLSQCKNYFHLRPGKIYPVPGNLCVPGRPWSSSWKPLLFLQPGSACLIIKFDRANVELPCLFVCLPAVDRAS